MRAPYLLIGIACAAIAIPASVRQVASDKDADIRAILTETQAAALQIKSEYQRHQILDEIGEAEAKFGDLDAAVEIASRAEPHTMSTLEAIAKELFKRGDFAQTHAVAAKLPGDSSSTVFCFIAIAQARAGNIEAALKTVEEIRVPEVRADALRDVAASQAEQGDYAGTRKSIGMANTLRPEDNESDEDAEILIAQGQIQRGEPAVALQTISSIKSAETKTEAMISFANAAASKGDITTARDWLTAAQRTMPNGEMAKGLLYFAIPTEVKAGLKADAMQQAATFEPELRAKAYTSIAVACAAKKDFPCMDESLEKLRSTSSDGKRDAELTDFDIMLSTLNVTGALIDAGALDQATRLLTSVEARTDPNLKSLIEPDVQFQRVTVLAIQEKFDEARALAARMEPNSASHEQRGKAFRTVALLETKKRGTASVRQWAAELADAEDRTNALLGVTQFLLGIVDVRIPYNEIQIH